MTMYKLSTSSDLRKGLQIRYLDIEKKLLLTTDKYAYKL